MKRIELSTLGRTAAPTEGPRWADLLEPGASRAFVDAIAPGSHPTEVQVRVLREAKLLTSRRNLLVSSTTNSGKTLIGYLALLRGLTPGKRVLLLEPLRALAQEKHAELSRLASLPDLARVESLSVEITTGDYRIDHERMQAPPPEGGQVVIATPERIEAILRNPDFDTWINSISTVVVDEAHLLGDPLRGAALEYVITSLKLLKVPPRIILLSATLGETTNLANWLDPCDTVFSPVRTPPLHRSILQIGIEDDLLAELGTVIAEILTEPGTGVLVFVYQTAAADKLARELAPRLETLAGPSGPKSYHSRHSAATREAVRREFMEGATRCVVSTTALAMGVNLPATHVILRDLARGGEGPIRPDELIQMTGRAGRGNREGHALLVLKPKDPWTEDELVNALDIEQLPPIRSTLIPAGNTLTYRDAIIAPPPLAKGVLSLLGRSEEGGLSQEDLERFLRATLAGEDAVTGLNEALSWLSASSRILAVCEEGQWKATTLGKQAIRASAPLEAAAGVAQLVRDLLSVDPEDEVLRSFSKLDLLILAELVSSGTSTALRFSEKVAQQVDAWMGQSHEKSILFIRWIRGAEGFSKAEELLGSLGLVVPGGKGKAQRDHRKIAYLATCRAIILWQRGLGVRASDLTNRWGVQDLEEVEEKWRDNRLFLLGAMASLWEVRCFYYHLREECEAGDERVWRVKRVFQRMGAQTYQLLDLIAWASPLGPLFVRMRMTLSGLKGSIPAHATLRRLEDHGVTTVMELRTLAEADYKKMGVRADLARVIGAFLRRGG